MTIFTIPIKYWTPNWHNIMKIDSIMHFLQLETYLVHVLSHFVYLLQANANMLYRVHHLGAQSIY